MSELRMKEIMETKFEMSDEERTKLRARMTDLLLKYGYHPTDVGLDTIIDEFVENKGWIVNLFRKHPQSDGEWKIVFDYDFDRKVDVYHVEDTLRDLRDMAERYLKVEIKKGAFSYQEISSYYRKIDAIITGMRYIMNNTGVRCQLADGRTMEDLKHDLAVWSRRMNYYNYCSDVRTEGDTAYDRVLYNKWKIIRDIISDIVSEDYAGYPLANEWFSRLVNSHFPGQRMAAKGQKVSRIMNKVFTELGLDKANPKEYNQLFAAFSDAANPLKIKRHTIISCDPIDYLTMSFGPNWSSCHTIDKHNIRHSNGKHYNGMYAGGTLSYMLDGSSFVFYTVKAEYDGNEYELQDKVTRNMFHMGNDLLVQGRVYPQGTDGSTDVYKTIREIVQKVVTDCLGVPNMWKNKRGTYECEDVIDSHGVHYRDYTNFNDCNVSFLKGDNGEIHEYAGITVGHDPICPHCGEYHECHDNLEHGYCYSGKERCSRCGYYHNPDNLHVVDGELLCEECCFYCEEHEEWEDGERFYVNNYGYVCNEALEENENIVVCARCGDYYLVDNGITTVNGRHYCHTVCASRDNYCLIDREWYSSDEIRQCSECGCLYGTTDENDRGLCRDCAAEAERRGN